MIDHSFVACSTKEYFDVYGNHEILIDLDIRFDFGTKKYIVNLKNPRFMKEDFVAPEIKFAWTAIAIDSLQNLDFNLKKMLCLISFMNVNVPYEIALVNNNVCKLIKQKERSFGYVSNDF